MLRFVQQHGLLLYLALITTLTLIAVLAGWTVHF